MNKAELTSRIAEKTQLTRAEASKVLDATLESITDALKQGETVTLTEFGIFTPKHRKERQGRNPKTGESVTIPAQRTVSYKPTKALKAHLNR